MCSLHGWFRRVNSYPDSFRKSLGTKGDWHAPPTLAAGLETFCRSKLMQFFVTIILFNFFLTKQVEYVTGTFGFTSAFY